MTPRRKDTRIRARRPLKPSELAVLIAAVGTFLSGLAALLNALLP